MAGKRQHYVPRLLQRGFLSDPNDEGERTWLHRRGAPARLVGIRDIGVEDWFYSRKSANGQPTLDDAITEYEGDLARTVKAFRSKPPGTEIASSIAAETVVHLVQRTAHLRDLLTTGISRIAEEAMALFRDPVRLSQMIGLTGPGLSENTMGAIRSSAVDFEAAGVPSAFTERLMAFLAREYGDQLVANAMSNIEPMFAAYFGDISSTIRNAHNRMLTRAAEENGWIQALERLSWSIGAAEDLILPDAVALSCGADGRLAPLLFTSGDDTELVVMPVASDRILIGRRDFTEPDLANFNASAAAASENFFVSARALDGLGLNDKIGTAAASALQDEVLSAIREAETARRFIGDDILPALPLAHSDKNFSYTISLADYGDAVHVKEVSDVVVTVVDTIARTLPLHELDGITVAIDYHAALSSLDRGDPNLLPERSGALGYGEGVAKPVIVIRDGVRKEHVVVSAGIAETWISEDFATRAFGLHTLYKMLAGVAHTTRYASASQIPFNPEPMVRILHGAVSTTPSGYWSAREAAFVFPDGGETYAALILESLAFANVEIAAQRAEMRDPSDVIPTTSRALQCISAVLAHAADWLGHRDGLPEGQSFSGCDLPQRLVQQGLSNWIELFGHDLAACYGQEGTLEISMIATLSRHVERLFWHFGLYAWPVNDDVRCIVSDQSLRLPSLV